MYSVRGIKVTNLILKDWHKLDSNNQYQFTEESTFIKCSIMCSHFIISRIQLLCIILRRD